MLAYSNGSILIFHSVEMFDEFMWIVAALMSHIVEFVCSSKGFRFSFQT